MNMQTREMTAAERGEIRALVEKHCANYDKATKECLPLECNCYMLGKCWTGAFCRYFETAVLPLAPMLEAAVLGKDGIPTRPCGYCGKPFLPKKNRVYCSASCSSQADRKRRREYMRKYRG